MLDRGVELRGLASVNKLAVGLMVLVTMGAIGFFAIGPYNEGIPRTAVLAPLFWHGPEV